MHVWAAPVFLHLNKRASRPTPPHGVVLEAENAGHMPGLGVLKHHALAVVHLVAHHRHAVVLPQVQPLLVRSGDWLHGDGTFAGDDHHAQLLLQVAVQRALGDLLRQLRHTVHPEIAVV